ncbi:MAG: peptide-binding protein [Nitrospirae bacterium]|nr:peptide-binding protein [Nitrospirota bacterium]
MRRILSVIFLIIFFLSLHGCKEGIEKQKFSESTLVVALASEPLRLNPVYLSDLVSFTVSELIFRGLVRLDKDMQIVPDLAESWKVSDDGKEIYFKLKKGVLWHDGIEFTSNDVVFTYLTVISPQTSTHLAEVFGPVKNVIALDRYTVLVRYNEPYGSALESWRIGIIPEHILHGAKVNNVSFDEAPIGTGPYKLKKWERGIKIILESFDNYYGGKPGIKNLILKIIPDTTTQLMEMKTGAIDVMEVSPLQFDRGINSREISDNFIKYKAGSFRYGFLGLNMLDERFRDKKVRQAISYSIDKKWIIQSVLNNTGTKSTGPYPPEAWYYNPEAKYYDYDPVRAIVLLKEAGWVKGDNGVLYKNNVPFFFTIFTNFENKENMKIAEIIQDNLKKIGIETEIQNFEWQTFRHNVINKHQFEAIVLSRAYLWDPDIYDLWHSSKTREGEWNFLSYKNPEIDRLLETGRKTINQGERSKIYRKVHEILAEDQACIFLYNTQLVFLAHRRIKGIEPSPSGILYNVEKWRIEL